MVATHFPATIVPEYGVRVAPPTSVNENLKMSPGGIAVDFMERNINKIIIMACRQTLSYM